MEAEEEVAHRLEARVEQRLEPLAAVRLVAGNTDSRRCSSDTLHTQHMDPGHHNIAHIVCCNPMLGFRLLERQGSLVELGLPQRLELATVGHRMHHIHLDRHSLGDRLAGSRLRILAAGEDWL